MNINWRVRIKNPVFWANIAAAIVLPLVVGVGLCWEDMTSWTILDDALIAGLSNPVVVVGMLISVWNAIIDPTTKGIKDSEKARGYETPAE